MKKVFICALWCPLLVLLFSCTNPLADKYFIQQQNKVSKDGGNSGGTVGGWQDEETDTGGDSGSDSGDFRGMFALLVRDGGIDTSELAEDATLAAQIEALKTKLAPNGHGEYPTAVFDSREIRAMFSGGNVPAIWFVSGNSWVNTAGSQLNEASCRGPNSSAGSNSITDIKYYRYKGYNPLFAGDSAYNKAEYIRADGSTKERNMERFEFYRFTGKGGGVAALDNMLVAVDTYTKLVFSFAKPTKSEPLLGQQVPKEWGPVDLVSTGPGGKRYKFYEYDPAGYVKEDGTVTLYEWYVNGMGRGNYDPVFTGKSPYLGAIGGGTANSGGISGGYAVTGVLTVKAAFLRNDTVTDTWGDHGNADTTDMSEFIYNIRARAYSGFEQPVWDNLSWYKPDQPSIKPKDALFIHKGATHELGGFKSYPFGFKKDEEGNFILDADGVLILGEGDKGDLTLELDSRIVEIDIFGNDWVTDYEIPVVFFSYDRVSQSWKPGVDNKTFMNGPVTYDRDFSLRGGETKEFLVKLPVGSGEYMTLCYELNWKGVADSSGGRIISAELVNLTTADDNSTFVFSGENTGEYTLEFTDFTQTSADQAKAVEFQLVLGNMLGANRPVFVRPAVGNSAVNNIRLANKTTGFSSASFITAYGDQNSVSVQFDIDANPSVRQQTEFTLNFSYDSGYDKTNSPANFTIKIIRNKYVSPQHGELVLSNLRLKNVSVYDAGGDAGDADGYKDPEFFWNLRARQNTGEWKTWALKNETNNQRISIGSQYAVAASDVVYTIFGTDSGIQRVYVDAEITERDRLAGNENDIICKFGKPLMWFEYNAVLNEWYYKGSSYEYFGDSAGNKWELKKVNAPVIRANESSPATITVTFSAYINDTIWLASIPEILGGPKPAGWGDMELTFDVEWRTK